MKLNPPKNANYAALVVEIKTLVQLDGCTNVQAAIILGNQVIVGKDLTIGTIGLYFPLECQLSTKFMSENNLFRNQELNVDTTKKGYFDENGRVRCQKFVKRHDSEGFFMPINSIEFTGVLASDLKVDDEFDELNGITICSKYIVKNSKTQGQPNGGNKSGRTNIKMKDKLVDKQFKFHEETSLLYKNVHKISPNSIIQISYKAHGSSAISSNVLVKKKLKLYEKVLTKLGVNIPDTEYGYIYSSGKPKSNLPKGILGKYVNDNGDFYSDNIWKESFDYLKDYLTPGLSIYYEIVGYTKSGGMVQGGYDYGCVPVKNDEKYVCGVNYKIVIYRVTMTNIDGVTVEFSPKQVQYWAIKNGLTPVHELFYGYAKDLFKLGATKRVHTSEKDFGEKFLELCKELFNEKDCFMCANKVPEEGCVIRVDGLKFEAYKVKSKRFMERETKQLDKGEVNVEDES